LANDIPPAPLSRSRSESNPHRPDIDGLRALAVLPVLFYHVGIRAIPGGFVGVDVFFVISGYLITQVLLSDIEQDRFSILGFYERRIRRILPALLVVLATTFFVYLPLSLPREFVDFSMSLIAAATSVSNIFFWLHAGYFDSPALTKPLLHTWSLAVEEQFYLFWPAYLFLACRLWRRHLILLTVAVSLISFELSAVGAFTDQSATFYLLHTRAWELLLGSLLAMGIVTRRLGTANRNVLSLIGFTLIAGSVLLVRSDVPFPGLMALPPCLGAALIILAGRDGSSLVGRALSWRPIAFVGLISYSLYLWHWPITVLQKTSALLIAGHSDMVQKLAIIGASLVMATLSWRFVEQPFRSGPLRPSRRMLLRFAGVGTGVIVLLGGVGWLAQGFPARYSDYQLEIAGYLDYDSARIFRGGRCFITTIDKQTEFAPECVSAATSKPNYLLMGDSHAADLWYGLNATYPTINFLQTTASNCFPTVDHNWGEWSRCTRLTDEILHNFLPAHHVDRVVIAARWRADLLPRVSATLLWFRQRGIPVTLVGPAVVYDTPLPRLILMATRKNDLALPNKHWDRSLRELDQQMSAMAQQNGAQYVSILELLCPQGICVTTDARGMPILSDREHFTADGSVLIARKLQSTGFWASESGLETGEGDRHGSADSDSSATRAGTVTPDTTTHP
jgi:peptidoglycan/LPS O-acetylase OafA/YrhL